MKIALVVPGQAGGFYCQNCSRDLDLVRALGDLGHEALLVPLYLPLPAEGRKAAATDRVFFGAIRLYLQERLPWLRRLPFPLMRLLDVRPLLGLAARRAGSVEAAGLEVMTLSMLAGEQGGQAAELERLVAWLAEDLRPDRVILSNALLIGLARRLRERLGVPVTCLLQDEHAWLDSTGPDYRRRLWAALAERTGDVDALVTFSRWYAGLCAERLQIPVERIKVIPPGVVPALPDGTLRRAGTTIGYLSRLCRDNGLDLLVEAFLQLRREPGMADLRLRAAGGWNASDRPFLDGLRHQVEQAGAADRVEFLDLADREGRAAFLAGVDLLSVPARREDALGLYLLEAMSAGVPVVQPRRGGFAELVEATGGGVLCEPEDPAALAAALGDLLRDETRRGELAARGRRAVEEAHSAERMARALVEAGGSPEA